jgi:hypothetical protein
MTTQTLTRKASFNVGDEVTANEDLFGPSTRGIVYIIQSVPVGRFARQGPPGPSRRRQRPVLAVGPREDPDRRRPDHHPYGTGPNDNHRGPHPSQHRGGAARSGTQVVWANPKEEPSVREATLAADWTVVVIPERNSSPFDAVARFVHHLPVGKYDPNVATWVEIACGQGIAMPHREERPLADVCPDCLAAPPRRFTVLTGDD